MQGWLRQQGVQCDLIPRDAHWQLSLPERSVGILKSMMTSLARSSPTMPSFEFLGRALAAYNDMSHSLGGGSPSQRLLGRTLLVTADLHAEPDNLSLLTTESVSKDAFGVSAELRRLA